MRVVFLDVDGVCNSLASALAYRTFDKFDDVSMHLLQRAATTLDLKFVLSSAWRVGNDIAGCRKIFKRRKYSVIYERLIGMTGRHSLGVRGNEIREWLLAWQLQFP